MILNISPKFKVVYTKNRLCSVLGFLSFIPKVNILGDIAKFLDGVFFLSVAQCFALPNVMFIRFKFEIVRNRVNLNFTQLCVSS